MSNPTSNRKTIPTFEGRVYTPDGNYSGNWVRRAEVDSLLDEIERLRASLQDLADCCGHDDDKALLIALRNAAKVLSGDSSVPETNAQPPLNFRSITTSVGGPNDPTVAMRFSSVEDAQAVHHWLATLQCAGSPEETSACLYESQDGDTLTYETTCGNIFRLDPVLDLYEFCPYCGKRVTVKASTPLTPAEMSTVARMAAVSAQIQQSERTARTCGECQTVNVHDQNHCGGCGSRLDGTAKP